MQGERSALRRDRAAHRLVAAIALVSTVIAAAPVRAGGFHISTLGVRRNGMLTNLANPDDATALFHNPAGLADLPGLQLQLSAALALLDSNTYLQALPAERFPAIDAPGCAQAGSCRYPIDGSGYYQQNFKPTSYIGAVPYLGFSLNLGKLRPRLRGLTISAALYTPGAYGASLPTTGPTSYYIVEGVFVIATASVGVGYRINRYVAIGGSLSYNYMRLGLTQKFSTTDALTPAGQAPEMQTRIAQTVLGDLSMRFSGADHGLGWSLGLLVNPAEWVAIGLSYSGWTAPTFDGDVEITADYVSSPTDLRALVGMFGYKLPRRLRVEMAIPPNVQGGVNFRPRRWIEIGFDARVWLYSLFQRQRITPVYDPADTGMEPLTEAGLSKAKGYSTSYQLNLGVLFRPVTRRQSLELMAGVGFDKSPVPDRTFSLDSPSFDQVYGAIGFRDMIGKHVRVGVSYSLSAYLARDIRTSETSPPTNVRASALGHMPMLEVAYLR